MLRRIYLFNFYWTNKVQYILIARTRSFLLQFKNIYGTYKQWVCYVCPNYTEYLQIQLCSRSRCSSAQLYSSGISHVILNKFFKKGIHTYAFFCYKVLLLDWSEDTGVHDMLQSPDLSLAYDMIWWIARSRCYMHDSLYLLDIYCLLFLYYLAKYDIIKCFGIIWGKAPATQDKKNGSVTISLFLVPHIWIHIYYI